MPGTHRVGVGANVKHAAVFSAAEENALWDLKVTTDVHLLHCRSRGQCSFMLKRLSALEVARSREI